ncbi:UDP-2,3-diacylglucosamine diphosphatase, partial [Pseudomonas aeruginosa]
KKIIHFFQEIEHTAAAIFIVGDIFDFWFEYKKAVPKYYTRLLGKLASLTDNNIPVYVFSGNHDMWMSGYFEEELNIPV